MTLLVPDILSFALFSLSLSLFLHTQLPESDGSNYQAHQNALNQAAQGLNIASSELLVTASRGTPDELAISSSTFSNEFQQLMSSGMGMAGAAPVSDM